MTPHEKWLKARLETNNSCQVAARRAFIIWNFNLTVPHYAKLHKRLQLL